MHKYNQVLPCDVLIVTADNNDAYSHSNLYYVWKKTIFILASFGGEMGHTVGEVGHNLTQYPERQSKKSCTGYRHKQPSTKTLSYVPVRTTAAMPT